MWKQEVWGDSSAIYKLVMGILLVSNYNTFVFIIVIFRTKVVFTHTSLHFPVLLHLSSFPQVNSSLTEARGGTTIPTVQ